MTVCMVRVAGAKAAQNEIQFHSIFHFNTVYLKELTFSANKQFNLIH